MSDKMFLLQKMGKTLTFSKVDPQSPTNRATQASSWLQPEQPTICGPPCILQPLFVESKAPRDAMTSTGWVKPWHSQKNQQNQEKRWKQSKVSTTMQPSHNLQTKMCPVFHPRLALLQLNCLPGHSLLYKTRSWLIFTWSHTHAFLQRVHHNTRPSTAKGAPRTRLRQAFQSKRASPHNLSCKTHTHTFCNQQCWTSRTTIKNQILLVYIIHQIHVWNLWWLPLKAPRLCRNVILPIASLQKGVIREHNKLMHNASRTPLQSETCYWLFNLFGMQQIRLDE